MANNPGFTADHINIRESVSFLIIRLTIVELFFSIIIFFIAFPFSSLASFFTVVPQGFIVRAFLFVFIIIFKLYFSFISIYQWLNEYYELTSTRLIHRKGFIFRKEQGYEFGHIRLAGIKQDFFGKLLNYGTIHLYDLHINKDIYLYLIHNPIKHFNLIKKLIPKLDEERETVQVRTFEE